MPKYRLDGIAGLARQMGFTPHRAREAQLVAAEGLLCDLDPSKAYPLDFVIFRITGYHPKKVADELLTGIALQHDLGLLIEQVSLTLELQAASAAVPVLSIDDVTEKFNVTTKTIQRWRRRGLAGRSFIFPDGKRRVGFLLSSVESFISHHQDQVQRIANFSVVGDSERVQIIRNARRLVNACRCTEDETARRIGRKLNRSPLTILHTIRRYDQECQSQAIFADAAPAVLDDERTLIIQQFENTGSIRSTARQMARPAAAIYRVVVEDRMAALDERKIHFIDDPLYHEPEARSAIEAIINQETITEPADSARVPRDLPAYFRDVYRIPLLSAARERGLFLKLNFHKFEFVTARRRLEGQFARRRDLDLLEAHLDAITDTRNQIAAANLRLVIGVARKHLRAGLNLMELVSDGNLTLLRAIDGFDIHRGNRFSTYATLALMKGFARSVPQTLASRPTSFGPGMLQGLADDRRDTFANNLVTRDEVDHLMACLDERERQVVRARFGIDRQRPESNAQRLSNRLGMSRLGVRRIQQSAMEKLRAAMGLES